MKRSLPLLLFTLVSCQQVPPPYEPRKINFDTDPAILRDAWSGELAVRDMAGVPLILNLKATYDSVDAYSVAGMGTLGAQPLTVVGQVAGYQVVKFIRAQTSPAPLSAAMLTLSRTGLVDLTLECALDGGTSWRCSLADARSTFTLSKGTP